MEGIIDLQLEMSFHFIWLLALVVYSLLISIFTFGRKNSNCEYHFPKIKILKKLSIGVMTLSILFLLLQLSSFNIEEQEQILCIQTKDTEIIWGTQIKYKVLPGYETIFNTAYSQNTSFKEKIFKVPS